MGKVLFGVTGLDNIYKKFCSKAFLSRCIFIYCTNSDSEIRVSQMYKIVYKKLLLIV